MKNENALLIGIYKWNFRNFFRNIKQIFENIKQVKQRIKYGICNYDCFDLDSYLANVMQKGFLTLSNQAHGWPEKYETYEDWVKQLKDLAELCNHLRTDDVIEENPEANSYEVDLRKLYKDAEEEATIAREVLFDWLKENFECLWD